MLWPFNNVMRIFIPMIRPLCSSLVTYNVTRGNGGLWEDCPFNYKQTETNSLEEMAGWVDLANFSIVSLLV